MASSTSDNESNKREDTSSRCHDLEERIDPRSDSSDDPNDGEVDEKPKDDEDDCQEEEEDENGSENDDDSKSDGTSESSQRTARSPGSASSPSAPYFYNYNMGMHLPLHPPPSQENFAAASNTNNHTLENAPIRRMKGGVLETFPEKLHDLLEYCENNGLTDVCSFFPHGRAFAVHQPRRFTEEIMPRFFKHTKLSSFHRQLNLYGFRRILQGPDHGGYYNPNFVRGHRGLASTMQRVKAGSGGGKRSIVSTMPK